MASGTVASFSFTALRSQRSHRSVMFFNSRAWATVPSKISPLPRFSATRCGVTLPVAGFEKPGIKKSSTGSLTISRLDIARAGRVNIASDVTIAPLGDDRWQILDLRPVGSGG